MIRRPPRSTQGVSSAASDVYKRQATTQDGYVVLQHQPAADVCACIYFQSDRVHTLFTRCARARGFVRVLIQLQDCRETLPPLFSSPERSIKRVLHRLKTYATAGLGPGKKEKATGPHRQDERMIRQQCHRLRKFHLVGSRAFVREGNRTDSRNTGRPQGRIRPDQPLHTDNKEIISFSAVFVLLSFLCFGQGRTSLRSPFDSIKTTKNDTADR